MVEYHLAPLQTLNTGAKISMVGLGCYSPDDPKAIIDGITAATKDGYTHFDTASFYENEEVVGEGLRASGVPRENLFVTTKLWNFDHHNVEEAFDKSLAKLNVDYIDLYLMHWPQATKPGHMFVADDTINFIDTWKAMEKLFETRPGKIKAIGVSNFSIKTLSELLKHAKIVPALNEIETHPYNQENELIQFCREKGIVVSAYTPLGQANSPILKDADIVKIAEEIGGDVTPAKVVLSWNVQRGVVILPKSSNPVRVKQNIELITLSDDHMQRICNISKDPNRHQRFALVYDKTTETVFGWTWEQLGWEKPTHVSCLESGA